MNMRFSQRIGLTPIKSLIQTESIDNDLKIAMWNVLYENLWSNVRTATFGELPSYGPENLYLKNLWVNYFKEPIHDMPYKWHDFFSFIDENYFESEWYEIYDFVEFTVKNYPYYNISEKLNVVLKKELSAYRFIGNELVKITSDEEIEEIEQASQISSPMHYASKHIQEALKLMADKQNPDYRNSIKESISAVEAICTAITKASGNEVSTLGAALKVIEKEGHIELHPALKQAFDKLYGYTSDDGIRHFLKSDKEVNFEDAKFMLVACSAFVNYLSDKSSKAGLGL